MLKLAQLQDQFQSYLLHDDNTIHSQIVATPKVPAETRLAIYQNAYYLRLLESLQNDYALLATVMGDEAFNEIGSQYINSHPSSYRSIRWYGKEMPAFLKQASATRAQPFLAELAAFEWLLTEVFDERDEEVVRVEEMAAIPFDQWPILRFQFHPSLRQITLHWNVINVFETMQTEKCLIKPKRQDSQTIWILWRKELAMQHVSLSTSENGMLQAMLEGKSFSEICECLCQWMASDKVAMFAASLLKRWIVDGLISKISLENRT